MKNSILLIMLFTTLLNNANSSNLSSIYLTKGVNSKASLKAPDLGDIQGRILEAFMSSFVDQNNSKLTEIIDQLEATSKLTKSSLIIYWKAYAQYYNSITYLKSSLREEAEDELDKAIISMESIEIKNSEDYALLSMLQSFSCQFAGFPSIILIVKNAAKNIDRAIELDATNMRALYVYASNDYHTPSKYGGGQEVEEYLLKSLSLPVQSVKNIYLPSWGRQEAFEMISNFYIAQKDITKSKQYTDIGLKEFPDSYILNKNRAKLSK